MKQAARQDVRKEKWWEEACLKSGDSSGEDMALSSPDAFWERKQPQAQEGSVRADEVHGGEGGLRSQGLSGRAMGDGWQR